MFEEVTIDSGLSEKKPTLIRSTFKIATKMVPDWKFFHPTFTFGVSENKSEGLVTNTTAASKYLHT
jgi:hypothetical protein